MSAPATQQDTQTRILGHNGNITIDEAIEALQHFEFQQNPEEYAEVLRICTGKSRVLEIGANFGGTIKRLARVLAPNSKIVVVDLPDPAHTLVEPLFSLKYACDKIAEMGHEVKLFIGNSHDPRMKELVAAEGPFDFAFIDGDHSYEGVKQDWFDYGPMAKVVGFHDTCGGTEGCVRFWRELKAKNEYRMEEYDRPRLLPFTGQWMRLGIGIVHREE